MILTFLGFGWIGFAAFLCGFACLQLLFPKINKNYYSLELYILFGLCFLTVYAQTFSLFHKVGALATGVLLAFCMLVLILLRKSVWDYLRTVLHSCNGKVLIALPIIGLLSLLLTVPYATHYDTGLYHAQSIRWIEEYGIVKGLGNLHNRLAYNSAFFSLQALFSLKFLVNQSLNTMNGFIAFLLLSYAVISQHALRKQKTVTSDLFKLGIIIYLLLSETKFFISSPGSDLAALSLVLYLCAKWCELTETDHTDETAYGLLCLLSLWAITIKLSAAMLILLAIYPAIMLLRNKRWKLTGLLIGVGIAIVLPFLARNVIISGYLLYPAASLDLFDVDWKMAASVAENDSKEITAWGRGLKIVEHYDDPASVWLPLWYDSLSVGYQILVWLNVACLIGSLAYALYCIRKRRNPRQLNLILFCAAGLLMWFLSAPLVRYGMIYLLLLPAFFLGQLLEKVDLYPFSNLCVALFLMTSLLSITGFVVSCEAPPLVRPQGYLYFNVTESSIDGVPMYIASGSDCVGYFYFPSTPNQKRLDLVELRTPGKLEDGFRLKEEYRDKNILTYGAIVD